MPLITGTKLGPYEIISALGAGGMGEVYRARDTRLDRTVAVKILPTHLSSSVELKVRFEREARAISSLNHPYICHLYDIGSQNGADYLVMEYLEGETLAQRLRKGVVPIKQALQFGVQIAEALEMAHRAGILHRDLKPGNVMLTPAGAKLMDFGLAKVVPVFGAMKATGAHTPSPTLSLAALSSPGNALTEQGTLVGTYEYIAPEVLQGIEADPRSDIFSLGCVLYEMVTGQRAFDGKSKLSVLTAILEKDPEPPSRLQPTSPPVLDHVIKTCLEKDPEQRFQTAHDVKLELRWIAGNDRLEVKGAARHRLRPGWIATGVVVLVAFAAAYLMLRPRPAPRNALYIGTLGSLQAKLLTGSESMAMYASGYLLYMRGQTLMARPFDVRRLEFAGEGVPVAEHVAVSGATNRAMFSNSNNGALIYETGEGVGEWSLQWFDSDGKQVGSVAQPGHYLWPTLSPDGKRIAVVIFSGVQGTGDVWIFDLAQGTRTSLTFSSVFQRYPVWSTDGKTIYYASDQKGALHIYARASDGSGPERVVLETNGMSEYPTSVSPDGHYLVYVSQSLGGQTNASVGGLPLVGGGKPFPIVQAGSGEVAPAISPDGRWLAYQSNESGRFELYVTAFPGGGAKWQVSTNSGLAARWRSDGKQLFFLDEGGTLMAADANISGNAPRFGAPRSLFHVEPNLNGPYDVTKDGKRFLVNSWSQKESGEPATLVLNWPAELKK